MADMIGQPAPVLDVQSLRIGFSRAETPDIYGIAVDEVSFTLPKGKTLCLVGESGCGKSVTALSLLRLLPSPPSLHLGGSVFFEGQDITHLPEEDLRALRGNRIGMIFQDPMTSLNPVMRVGEQMMEGVRRHRKLSASDAHDMAVAMFRKVGIAQPEQRIRDFPHQMSGGMRQRVMIGMALACAPSLIIADEPTTALDVTVQKQILALMHTAITETESSLLLITHDLGIVAQVADYVSVMYAGRIVEQGIASDVLESPQHPYTMGLLRSRPSMRKGEGKGERLTTIPGSVPGLWERPSGCTFHPRCAQAFARCQEKAPPLIAIQGGTHPRQCRCWLSAQ